MYPRARQEGLIIHDLPEELLIYDLTRHRAHCLNRTARILWRHCDGQTPVRELAQRLAEDTGQPIDETIVWLGLEQLAEKQLLQESLPALPSAARPGRRELSRRAAALGGLALLLPMVQSILAPDVAAAASGTTQADCFRNGTANDGKCCIDVNPRRLCRRIIGSIGLCLGTNC